MINSLWNKIKFNENCTLGVADVLLVYTMLAPIIFLIIGKYTRVTPNFIRTLIVLLGPGLLAGAIYFRTHGIQELKKSKWILLCTVLFALIVFVSSIKHLDTGLTREGLKFFVGWCLFGFCLGALSQMSIKRTRQLTTIWIVFIVGILAYAIYQQWPHLNHRFDLPEINNAQIGTLFYFFALSVLFKFDSSLKILARIALISLLSLCFLMGFYSGTRTAFFGFAISFVIYLFFYSHIRLNKIYPIIIVCFVIIVFLILLPSINKSIRERYVEAFADARNVIKYVFLNDSSSYNSVDRIRIWEDAFSKFKKNPVFGSGLGISYRDKLDKIVDRKYVHPHNIILELLAETGIVGFGVFAVLFGLIFKRAVLIYRQLAIDNRMTFLFYPLALIFFFIFSSLHTDLSTEYFKWYFGGFIAGFDIRG